MKEKKKFRKDKLSHCNNFNLIKHEDANFGVNEMRSQEEQKDL